jgi:hypothetical protein
VAVTFRLLPCSFVAAALAGCAPLSTFRPASGIMDDRSFEVGGGGTLVSPRPYVEEPVQAGVQAWVSGRATKALTLTGMGAAEASAFALGGAARVDVLRTDRLALGPEFEVGFLWGAANFGGAVRLFDQSWFYTAPRFGNRGSTWALDLPAGLSFRIYEGLMLRTEYRVTWTGELSYYQQRRMFGAAVAVQF